MEFGRKGDNKRAMDLMWKSGMSLKAAWRVVKGKKPVKRKKTTRRNCFGAGACAEGYEINPATGRMRKMCEYGRDIRTGKCLKPPRVIKDAPIGYEYNVNTGKYRKMCEHGRNPKTGRCLPMSGMSGMVAMKEGYEINPSTGRLRKICVYGRNPVTGKCHGRPMDQSMAPPIGFEYAPNGKLRKICLYGRDPVSGRCVGKPRIGPVGVPEGYEINPITGRYRQMCPPGYVRNARGRCVQVKMPVQFEDALDLDFESSPEISYPIVPYSARTQSSTRLSPTCLNNPFMSGCFDSRKPRRSKNPFDDNYDTQDPFPSSFNPFDDTPVEEEDFDPFSVFSFGKKRRPRPKTRRSCFGSCSSCDY